MEKKIKMITELDEKIKDIDNKMKIINKELSNIRLVNQILISQIQEILDTSSL